MIPSVQDVEIKNLSPTFTEQPQQLIRAGPPKNALNPPTVLINGCFYQDRPRQVHVIYDFLLIFKGEVVGSFASLKT